MTYGHKKNRKNDAWNPQVDLKMKNRPFLCQKFGSVHCAARFYDGKYDNTLPSHIFRLRMAMEMTSYVEKHEWNIFHQNGQHILHCRNDNDINFYQIGLIKSQHSLILRWFVVKWTEDVHVTPVLSSLDFHKNLIDVIIGTRSGCCCNEKHQKSFLRFTRSEDFSGFGATEEKFRKRKSLLASWIFDQTRKAVLVGWKTFLQGLDFPPVLELARKIFRFPFPRSHSAR